MSSEPDQAVIKAIKACHITNDELYTLMEEVCEGQPSKDQMANILSGIMDLNKLRIQKAEREYRYSVTHAKV